ncbi:tetratricopeptide repeat protein [Intrasporangium sp.]|uniref:tetratricopeptide repeat protein n=1 Tax=Intrasporangium sp. TaxID=1925024 RepID=UPI0029396F91|nr:tetratricopeptide repeat protein [Intrasporangium sp.]MDV3222412.1 tetratricopeptide repeat protein [Intrasporangium sp.]
MDDRPDTGIDYPYDLGRWTREVTASSDAARGWVQRGLVWAYAFNHEEAVACYERALALDPDCVLAHWGIAHALAPNYNKPWEFYAPEEVKDTVTRAYAAQLAARQGAASATPVERDLAEAMASRFPEREAPAEPDTWEAAYAEAMERVHEQHPNDLDVVALYAESLMNLTAWQLWDQRTGEPAPGSRTVRAKEVLDRALSTREGRGHPGILHLYVHLMEMSPRPEEALWVGDLLRDLVPDAGHLRHMPTHLDVLCGDYRRVVASNRAAVRADAMFLAERGPINFYTLYRAHNLHFLVYGAMFLGQEQTARAAVADLEAAIPEELLRVEVPPMADWLEGFVPMRVHVLIRFGRWEELLALPLPSDPELYATTTAMTRYGRGIALAATGRVDEAEAERALFRSALDNVPQSRMLFNNTCRDILEVASSMLDGELEYRRGRVDAAFAHLRRSVELDDGLPYDEPWGWMQPARHALGALLLEQGRVEEAEVVYRADLGLDPTLPRACQHPGNVWSLHGYHECLVRLGKTEAAGIVEQQLRIASAQADVPIRASCLCRLETTSQAAAFPSRPAGAPSLLGEG